MALEVHTTELRARDNMSPVFRQAGTAATQMGREIETAGRTGESSLGRMRAAGAAFGTVLGTTAGLLSDFARAAAEEEITFSRLQTAVENTGVAYDDYAQRINNVIKQGESLSFADDQVAEALTRLTVSTGDANVAMEQIGLAMDLARSRGISLSQAAEIVGKVYGGNLGVLTRYGIVLDDNATKEEALATLQARVAGQAETYAKTSQGAVDRYKNAIDNATESLGQHTGEMQTLLMVLPGLSAGYSLAAGALGSLVGGLTGTAGATGAMAAFGGAIAGVGLAAAAVTPGLAVLAYTIYTATDNMDAMTVKTKDINQALIDLGMTGDEAARRIFGAFQQTSNDAEFVDPITSKIYDLQQAYPLLMSLNETNAKLAIEFGKSLNIDWANADAAQVQLLIEQVVLLYRAQQTYNDEMYTTMELQRAQGRNAIVTPGPKNTPITTGNAEELYKGMYRQAKVSVQDLGELNAASDAIGAYETSMYAAITGVNKWSQDQNKANDIARQAAGDYWGMVDGMNSASDAQMAFKAAQDGLLGTQQVYSQQQSEYQSQMSALEAGYAVLQERQAAGIPLTEEEQALLDNYPDLYGRLSGGADDAAVAQALLAAQYAENMKKGDELNSSMQANTDITAGLVRTVEDLIMSLGGVPDSVKTDILLNRADESISDLINYLSWLNSIPGSVTTVVETIYQESGDGSGGRYRGAALGGMIEAAAHGRVTMGNYTLVGEGGPELVRLPGGSMVTPHSATRALMDKSGGQAMTISGNTIILQPASGDLYGELYSGLLDFQRGT